MYVPIRVRVAPADRCIGTADDVLPQGQFVHPVGDGVAKGVRPPAHRRADRVQFGSAPVDRLDPRRGEIGHDHPPRHPVDHGVVNDDEQATASVRSVEPDEPDHAARRGIQSIGGRLQFRLRETCEPVLEVPHRVSGDDVPGIDGPDRENLGPPTGLVVVEAGAKHVVAVQDRLRGREQVRLPHPVREVQQHRLREAADPATGAPHQPRQDRSERYIADAAPVELGKGLAPCVVGHRDRREGRDGSAIEHVPRCHGQPGRLRPCHELDRHDAVATEIEERVLDPDRLQAQHIREDTHEGRLGGGRGRTGRRHLGADRRLRQCRAVELAVHGHRDPCQHRDVARHHVRRQSGGNDVVQPCGVDVGARRRDHVRHQPVTETTHATDVGDHVCHGRMLRQHRLDLAEFDPVTVQLDLSVAATEVLQRADVGPPHPVPGAVHALAGFSARVGHEAGRRQRGPAMVAAGQPGPGQVQLAGCADRDGPEPIVEDEGVEASDGSADRHGIARFQPRARRPDHGGLGGAVGVDHRAAARPAGDDVGRQRFTGREHTRQAVELGRTVGIGARRCHRQRGRCHDAVRHLLGRQQPTQLLTAVDGGRGDHQRGSDADREQQFEDRHVETG
ncbi:hypothetical protein RE9416_43110 [Prescottella equi]|nr:hypothetical protein RE9416_43110 [Prescottella equi]